MMNADDYVCSLTAAALASEDGREAVELAMLGIGWAARGAAEASADAAGDGGADHAPRRLSSARTARSA